MKLTKKLTVDGKPVKLIDERIFHALKTPGRASFHVQSSTPLSGIVRFEMGYQVDQLQPYFLGYVENSNRIDDKHQRIFCRELTGALSRQLPASLRHVTLAETLAYFAEITGLQFVVPEQQDANSYTKKKAPFFYSAGDGYHCFDSMARVYDIPQFIWQQQGDGRVYVGSWLHSWVADKSLPIDEKWFTNHGIANSAKLPALPKLRTGLSIPGRGIITDLEFSGNSMNITWSKNPW